METPLGSDLARLVRIWRALIDHRLKPLELTQTHWVTLHNIHQLPPEQSQIQLAKAIGIEQPSLVRTLDQLEEKGLISRQTCAKIAGQNGSSLPNAPRRSLPRWKM